MLARKDDLKIYFKRGCNIASLCKKENIFAKKEMSLTASEFLHRLFVIAQGPRNNKAHEIDQERQRRLQYKQDVKRMKPSGEVYEERKLRLHRERDAKQAKGEWAMKGAWRINTHERVGQECFEKHFLKHSFGVLFSVCECLWF